MIIKESLRGLREQIVRPTTPQLEAFVLAALQGENPEFRIPMKSGVSVEFLGRNRKTGIDSACVTTPHGELERSVVIQRLPSGEFIITPEGFFPASQ